MSSCSRDALRNPRWRQLAAAALALTVAAHAHAAPRFGFGQTVTPAAIAGWDIDVRPDGMGLPPGRGSVAAGQELYDAKCAGCHGTFGESADYMMIAGGVGSLRGEQPVRTTGSKLNHATTLWDYINRAMPFGAAQTLAVDEVYALTAYVLHLNDLLPADGWLDRAALVAFAMPNRNGFTTAHGMGSRDGKADTANVACMRDCAAPARVATEIASHARDSHGDLASQVRGFGPVAATRNANSVRPPGARASRDAALLAKDHGCMSCHATAGRVLGPGFREIAAKHGNAEGAEAALAASVRQGGVGAWGRVPMPPQLHVGEADAKAIAQWIVGGAR